MWRRHNLSAPPLAKWDTMVEFPSSCCLCPSSSSSMTPRTSITTIRRKRKLQHHNHEIEAVQHCSQHYYRNIVHFWKSSWTPNSKSHAWTWPFARLGQSAGNVSGGCLWRLPHDFQKPCKSIHKIASMHASTLGRFMMSFRDFGRIFDAALLSKLLQLYTIYQPLPGVCRPNCMEDSIIGICTRQQGIAKSLHNPSQEHGQKIPLNPGLLHPHLHWRHP